MRHNGRPRLLASTLALTRIDPETRTVVCPRCETWRGLTRSIIRVHSEPTASDKVQGSRCPGSGQRITMDVTVEEWRRRLVDGERDAGSRRATRVAYKPAPPAPPTLTRLREPAPTGRSSARTRAAQWAAVVPTVALVDSDRSST